MKWREIASRITGFSGPGFGISWTPPAAEVTVARRVIQFLEDRRVLYNPYHLEVPEQCVHSVVEIRKFITTELGNLDPSSELVPHLRAIRAACRKFLDNVNLDQGPVRLPWFYGRHGDVEFFVALGEFRGAMSPHVAAIAVRYGIDVEGDLARILPIGDDEPGASDVHNRSSQSGSPKRER
jgi:hypothetical protein